MEAEHKVKLMVKDERRPEKPRRNVRDGWDEKFERSVVRDERLLIPELRNRFDETEWTWSEP